MHRKADEEVIPGSNRCPPLVGLQDVSDGRGRVGRVAQNRPHYHRRVSTFVSGRELSRRFYEEQVRPVLHTGNPGLPFSAALLGRGSEVLGFDDEMSRDHNWEPRVLLFLRDDDYARHGEAVERSLRDALPGLFAGYPTQFSLSTLRTYVQEHLDLDIDAAIEAGDWLTLPEQRLRMVTAGAVYHDEVGLQVLRDRLAYYPHDVWLYLLIAAWWRVHPEANLMGRAGFVGDELGSGVIARSSSTTSCTCPSCWRSSTRPIRSGSGLPSPGSSAVRPLHRSCRAC